MPVFFNVEGSRPAPDFGGLGDPTTPMHIELPPAPAKKVASGFAFAPTLDKPDFGGLDAAAIKSSTPFKFADCQPDESGFAGLGSFSKRDAEEGTFRKSAPFRVGSRVRFRSGGPASTETEVGTFEEFQPVTGGKVYASIRHPGGSTCGIFCLSEFAPA